MTKEEKAAAVERDPLPAYRVRLITAGIATEQSLAAMEAKISADIEDAIEFALNSEDPPLEELTTDVYGAATGACA
jgi:pyruvate dehydrogenase E1 component alpha subunit